MILRSVLAMKLHGLAVTHSHLYYSGSIRIPASICELSKLRNGDQISVYNFNSGHRYDTYVLAGAEGEISVNGPSARLSQIGDRLVIVQYVMTDEVIDPIVLFFDRANAHVSRDDVFP